MTKKHGACTQGEGDVSSCRYAIPEDRIDIEFHLIMHYVCFIYTRQRRDCGVI